MPITVGHRYRANARNQRSIPWAGAALVFAATFAVGMAWTNWPSAQGASGEVDTRLATFASLPRFSICGERPRVSCVVDGDTFWLDGDKIRVADIDTPEMAGRCPYESELAVRARNRLQSLLNEGPFDLQRVGSRSEDQYGRLLRVVVRDGQSLGDVLVSEGLARTWTGRREPWC